MVVPTNPKIYHIVHVDRLLSIVNTGHLLCDEEVARQQLSGTTIGMEKIKQRRQSKLVRADPDISVSDCTPFYSCPRSVMLYVICKANHPSLLYKGGQNSIVHLEADLHKSVEWAEGSSLHWAFTAINATSKSAEFYTSLDKLDKINWNAVSTNYWESEQDDKQAEFLVENRFPWELVSSIGVLTAEIQTQVEGILSDAVAMLGQPSVHKPVFCKPEWYY